jgi:hypothetical protein
MSIYNLRLLASGYFAASLSPLRFGFGLFLVFILQKGLNETKKIWRRPKETVNHIKFHTLWQLCSFWKHVDSFIKLTRLVFKAFPKNFILLNVSFFETEFPHILKNKILEIIKIENILLMLQIVRQLLMSIIVLISVLHEPYMLTHSSHSS